MSSSKLKQATQYVIERAQQRKKTTKKSKDSQARSDAEKEPGQFFVINKENEAAKIYKVTGIRLNKKERRTLFALLLRFLRRKEAGLKLDPELKRFLFSQKSKFKVKSGDAVFIVSNFEAAKTIKFKSKNKEDIAQIEAKFLNSLQRSQRSISASELSRASQIGHGDRGIAASQFGLERAVDEAAAEFDLSDSEIQEFRSIILRQRQKYNLKVNVDHRQFISSNRFNKKFSFILSSQYFAKNQADAQIESKAFADTLQDLAVLEQETSTKPPEAILEVLATEITPKKASKRNKPGRKVVKESSRASTNKKNTTEKVVAYQATRGVPLKGKVKKQRAKKGASARPLYLLGILNKRLPEVVAKNMEPPRLEYRTGRFASSVKATDIITTRKGFPSIGYTYDSRYQTFEPGYRQGSTERDPRKLIDTSIREIAAEFALGRFYTRRM